MIVLIEIVIIIAVVGSIISSRKKSAEIQRAAENYSETKSMVDLIRAASAIKADKICCALSIKKYSSAENALIQLKITLQDSKIASICFSAKQKFAAMHQAQDEAIKRGDTTAMHEWENRMAEEHSRMNPALIPYFPQDGADGSFLMDRFADVQDDSLVASAAAVSVSIPWHIGDLGIDSSQNTVPRSPYVLDAIAEAAKSIPNVSLTIDKTISNQNN